MFTHAPTPYPLYGHVQGYYFPAAPEHIPFPAAPPMYAHPPADGFSHLAPPPYSFEAPQQHYLPPCIPSTFSTAPTHTAMPPEEPIPPIQISIAEPEVELKALPHAPAATTVTVSQATSTTPAIQPQQAEMAQEKMVSANEAMANLQKHGFLSDLKPSVTYLDNVPRPQWLEKHALAKTGLTPEDFLPAGSFEKYSSKYLTLKKGGLGVVAGLSPTAIAALGMTAAVVGGAHGPFAPIAWGALGAAGGAPLILGSTIGYFRSKNERNQYQEKMLQMKGALDENPERYSAYLRTSSSLGTKSKAKKANKEEVAKLRNYLESGSEKSVMWKARFPIARDKIMVITTVDPKNAAQLFYKALESGTQKAAKKAGKQAAHLA